MLVCESAGGASRLQGHGIPRVVLLVVIGCGSGSDGCGGSVDRCRGIGVIDLVGSGHAGSGNRFGRDIGGRPGIVRDGVVARIFSRKGKTGDGNGLVVGNGLVGESAGGSGFLQDHGIAVIVLLVVIGCRTGGYGG